MALTELYQINVGTIVKLTKEQILEQVEVTSKTEQSLEDKEYTFMIMGKRELTETLYLLFPYGNDTIDTFGTGLLYSYQGEAYVTDEKDLDFFIESIEYRLTDALTSYIEYPDEEYLDSEINISRQSIKVAQVMKELYEISG